MSVAIAAQPPAAQATKPQRTFTWKLQAALARAARQALPCNQHMQAVPVLAAADQQKADFLSDVPMFASAKAAVVFAIMRDGSPSRPFYSTHLDKMTLIGINSSGLSTLDAAAQAGIIMAVLVRGLGGSSVSALVAASAPHMVPCSCERECCSGHRVFRPWRYAIDYLVQASQEECEAKSALRRDLLVKIYDRGRLDEIAKQYDLEETDIVEHHRALLRWLRGAKGKRGEAGIEGLERKAWREAESVLRDHRIVG